MGALTSMGSGAIRMSSGGVELLHGSVHDRKGGGVGAGPKSTGICPPLQRLEMYIVQPIMAHRWGSGGRASCGVGVLEWQWGTWGRGVGGGVAVG